MPETPGHPLTLTMQRGNYINLVAFWIVARSQRAMKSVKHRKLSCYCPVPKKGSNTVRFTFAFLTLARVSLSVSLFFSPLSLRRGVVVVCFEVIIGELLCLTGLCHVISGILAGGIPGFRMVLLLLHSPSGMAWFLFDVLPSASAAIPCRDDTMLSSLA